jgi:hypothetical protein
LTRLRNLLGCLIAVSLLSGCATFTAVPPGKKHEIGGVFRAEPSKLWSASKGESGETWTINGFALETISFITKVGDGKAIAPRLQGEDAPTFRADMSATDVVDLYEALLASRNMSQVEVTGLRPHEISGHEAFRFEYSGFDGAGLAKQGMVIALIDKEKGLNLVTYEGAREHYYGASLAAAESVFNSLEKI